MLRTAYTAVLVSALLLAAGALACSRSGRGP